MRAPQSNLCRSNRAGHHAQSRSPSITPNNVRAVTPLSGMFGTCWRNCLLLHVHAHGYHSIICNATRDVQFAYQKDIQTKLKPGVFAERTENRFEYLQAAQDWQQVVGLFRELGPDAERNVGLVAEMLMSLQRLAPPASSSGAACAALSPVEAQQLAAGIQAMSDVLLDRLDKVGNKQLISIIWALALLPDPTKAITSKGATEARARAVAGFGAAVLTRMNKLLAEELFHVLAGLALLGFKPPRTLQRDVPEQDALTPKALTAQPVDAVTAEMRSPPGPVKFATLLERRSIKVMPYVNAKGFADAGFVVSRLVPAGDMSQEWLQAYAMHTKQHLEAMQPEALVYAGYALSRHGHRPSNSWQKTFIKALEANAKNLAGEEFPMALFTLALWHRQRQQPQHTGAADAALDHWLQAELQDDLASGSLQDSTGRIEADAGQPTGTSVPQNLLDTLLLASHTNRAVRDLPLGQLAVMVNALAELQLPVSQMWMQRLWPLTNTKIDAAVASSTAVEAARALLAHDLALLLAALPRLNPKPSLPVDYVEGLAGNLGLGVQHLTLKQLSAVWAALQHLQHTPDAIFVRQFQQAVLAAALKAEVPERLVILVQLGLSVGLVQPPEKSGSSSSTPRVHGCLSQAEFLQEFAGALQKRVGQVVALVASAGPAIAAAAGDGGRGSSGTQQQQQQLLAAAESHGLWSLPDVLLSCLELATVEAGQASSSSCSWHQGVQEHLVPVLQQLWRTAVVGLAAAMPTDPLLALMGSIVDLPSESMQLLALDGDDRQELQQQGSKASVLTAVMQSAVYPRFSDTHVSSTSSKRPSSGAAAAALAESFQGRFAVADVVELLVCLADGGVDVQPQLLDAAAEVLYGATAPKGPAFGLSCTQEDVDELARELSEEHDGYILPTKVRSRYLKWRWPEGVPPQFKSPANATRKAAAVAARKAKVRQHVAAASTDEVADDLSVVAVPQATGKGSFAGRQQGRVQESAATILEAVAPAATTSAVAMPAVTNGIVRSSRSRPGSRVTSGS